MFTRTLVALAASGALLVPATAATATTPSADAKAGGSIAGTWKGGVHGDEGASAGYKAKVKVVKKSGKWKAKIAYPKYDCKGTWKFKGKSGKKFRFVEKITTGPCVDGVKVVAQRKGSKLLVKWTEPATGDTATMKAKKV